MLKGYEVETHELRPYELVNLLPLLVTKMCLHNGKSKAITNNQLRQYIGERGFRVVHEPRIRKILEYIRQKRLLEGLVATKAGYFIAESPEELKEWIDVMKQRRNALNESIWAGQTSFRKMTGTRQPNQHKRSTASNGAKQNFIFQ